jgi:hypothetical protein
MVTSGRTLLGRSVSISSQISADGRTMTPTRQHLRGFFEISAPKQQPLRDHRTGSGSGPQWSATLATAPQHIGWGRSTSAWTDA